jgi:hypothetical protein
MVLHSRNMRQSKVQRLLCFGIDPLGAPNDTKLFADTLVQLLLLYDSGLIAMLLGAGLTKSIRRLNESRSTADLRELAGFVARGDVKPRMGEVFPLEQARNRIRSDASFYETPSGETLWR